MTSELEEVFEEVDELLNDADADIRGEAYTLLKSHGVHHGNNHEYLWRMARVTHLYVEKDPYGYLETTHMYQL